MPVLVYVRDRRYRLDWESAGGRLVQHGRLWTMTLPLLPDFDAVIAQYRDLIDRN